MVAKTFQEWEQIQKFNNICGAGLEKVSGRYVPISLPHELPADYLRRIADCWAKYSEMEKGELGSIHFLY